MKWHDRKKETPKFPIDKKGYLCRCNFGNNPSSFYMVLQYYGVDKTPHFQHELGSLNVTHWAKIEEPETKKEE